MTAALLAPLALGLIFGLPPVAFAGVLAALLLVGAWEFRALAGLRRGGGALLVIAQAATFAALLGGLDHWLGHAARIFPVFCVVWMILLLRLPAFDPADKPGRRFRLLSSAGALLALTGAWMALAWLHHLDQGAWWILCLLLVIWSADIGAYFSGRAWGGRKLAPRLSPGKTWSGLLGGLAAATAVGWAALYWLPTSVGGGAWLALSAATALISVGGDLYISLHKRVTGVKDSGRLFPGHGGVLDRLDSLLAGAPLFAAGAALAGVA